VFLVLCDNSVSDVANVRCYTYVSEHVPTALACQRWRAAAAYAVAGPHVASAAVNITQHVHTHTGNVSTVKFVSTLIFYPLRWGDDIHRGARYRAANLR
jgi:hypothetical protein